MVTRLATLMTPTPRRPIGHKRPRACPGEGRGRQDDQDLGCRRRLGSEPTQHGGQVGQFAGVESRIDRCREVGLHAAIVCQGEQADHGARRVAHRTVDGEGVPSAPVSGAWPQRVAIRQIGQGARFGPQRGDHVVVVDHVNGAGALGSASAPQAQQKAAAEIDLDVVVVDAQTQAMANQPARHGVEDVAAHEAGRAGHAYSHLFPRHRRLHGQRLQHGALGVDHGGMASIVLAHHVCDEGAVGVEIVETGGSAQEKCLGDALLDVAVAAFDGAVLVGDATVVAAWHHAEMGDECLETLRQIVRVGLGQVAECRRKAVAAVLLRHTPEQAQGILQAARQGRVALAAEHDLDMLEAGTGQREMIQPMFEALATDDDAEIADIGEIG